MNLLSYTLRYLYATLLVVISIWAILFYFKMISEIRDSLDDGLENDKMLVIHKVAHDKATITRAGFSEHNYSISPLRQQYAQQVKDNFKDTMMYTLNERDLEPFRVLTTAFRNNGSYYQLKVVASTLEQDDLVRSLLFSLLGLYIAILISILIINRALLRKIWIPFHQLLSRLKNFKLDQDVRIEISKTNIREFEELNLTVSGLVDQSVKVYGSQKQFIENAAHELQTPLAISLNRLELLAEDDNLSQSNLESVGKVITTLQRLARLNRTLLLISKIENKQFGSAGSLSINELMKIMINEYREFAASKNVTLVFENKEVLLVVMNRDLASVLMSNLLKNAINHNIPGGTVKILITDKNISFVNTGKKVPLDPQIIFERFNKGSSSKNSTGLGLAIVKSISTFYHLDVLYFYNEQHHFKVVFRT